MSSSGAEERRTDGADRGTLYVANRGQPFEPKNVEALAKSMAKAKKVDVSKSAAFYRDLSEFMSSDTAVLAGHEILICQDGSLRAARSQAQAEPADGVGPRRRRRRADRETIVDRAVLGRAPREGRRLTRQRSNRVWTFARLLARATDVLGGRDAAVDWLTRPAMALERRRCR